MLTVKLNNGNYDGDGCIFTIENVEQFRQFQNTLISEFIESEVQRRIESEGIDYKEDLERILDAADYDNADDLIDWIAEAKDVYDDLRYSDYDSISDMTSRIEELESAIDDIYHSADNVRNW